MNFVTANQGREYQTNNCVDQQEKSTSRTRKGLTVAVWTFVIVQLEFAPDKVYNIRNRLCLQNCAALFPSKVRVTYKHLGNIPV